MKNLEHNYFIQFEQENMSLLHVYSLHMCRIKIWTKIIRINIFK